MYVEYEATFLNVDKNKMREKLREVGAKLVKPEFLQKRVVFNLPGNPDGHKWARVRNEGDKITMSFKEVNGSKIDDQKEINLTIDDFKNGVEFLETLGCQKKSYQETKREVWILDDVEVCVDEWPFLEPFVEVEGKSEAEVRAVSQKIGFDYSKAWFCSTGLIYSRKYNIPVEIIDNDIPKIVFNMENPFLKFKRENKNTN